MYVQTRGGSCKQKWRKCWGRGRGLRLYVRDKNRWVSINLAFKSEILRSPVPMRGRDFSTGGQKFRLEKSRRKLSKASRRLGPVCFVVSLHRYTRQRDFPFSFPSHTLASCILPPFFLLLFSFPLNFLLFAIRAWRRWRKIYMYAAAKEEEEKGHNRVHGGKRTRARRSNIQRRDGRGEYWRIDGGGEEGWTCWARVWVKNENRDTLRY